MTAAPEELALAVHTDPAAVAVLESAWRDLVWRSSCNRAFSSPVWYQARARIFAESAHLITAHRGPVLVGAFPLVRRTHGEPPVLQLAFVDAETADYQDLVVERGDRETARRLVRFALDGLRASENLVLSNFRSDSNVFGALKDLEDEIDIVVPLDVAATCPVVDLQGGWDAIFTQRSANVRRNLRAAQRRAQKAGFVHQVIGSDRKDDPAIVRTFLDLHLERKAEQGVKSIFHLPNRQTFLQTVVPPLLAEGSLIVRTLENGTSTAAIFVEAVGDGTVLYWNAGFLNSLASISPGRILLAEGMQAAVRAGFAEYDFGKGIEDWKKEWWTGHRNCYSVTVRRAEENE